MAGIPLALNVLDDIALRIMCAALASNDDSVYIKKLQRPHAAYQLAKDFLAQTEAQDRRRALDAKDEKEE